LQPKLSRRRYEHVSYALLTYLVTPHYVGVRSKRKPPSLTSTDNAEQARKQGWVIGVNSPSPKKTKQS